MKKKKCVKEKEKKMVVKVNVEQMEKAVEVEQEEEMNETGLIEDLSMCVFVCVLFVVAVVVMAATWPLWLAYAVWSIVKKA